MVFLRVSWLRFMSTWGRPVKLVETSLLRIILTSRKSRRIDNFNSVWSCFLFFWTKESMLQSSPNIRRTQQADEAEIFDLFSCESQQLVTTQFRCSCFRNSRASLFVMTAGLNDPGWPYLYIILRFNYLSVTAISTFLNECLCAKTPSHSSVMKLYLRKTPIQERMKIETTWHLESHHFTVEI